MFWSSGPGVCLSSQHPLPPSTSKRPARALLKPSCIACGAPSCPVSRSEGSVQPLNPHPYHPGRRVPSYVSEALARTLPPIPAAVAPAAAHQLLLPPLWTAPPARLQEVPLSPASRSTEPPGPSSRDTSSSPAPGSSGSTARVSAHVCAALHLPYTYSQFVPPYMVRWPTCSSGHVPGTWGGKGKGGGGGQERGYGLQTSSGHR